MRLYKPFQPLVYLNSLLSRDVKLIPFLCLTLAGVIVIYLFLSGTGQVLAGLTGLIAINTVYIAYHQLRVNQDKLKLDLYNKRFNIYQKTLDLYFALGRREKIARQKLHEFIPVFRESKFLFDDRIYNILDQIHDKSFKITPIIESDDDEFKNPVNSDAIQAEKEITENIYKLENYLSCSFWSNSTFSSPLDPLNFYLKRIS